MFQIRLKKVSSGKDFIYYIVATKKNYSVTRGFLEKIGSYNPHPDKWNNKYVIIDYDRLYFWINKGASINLRLFLLLMQDYET